MFGLPIPDLNEITRQVDEWKSKLERLVSAVEKIADDQAKIKAHLGIIDAPLIDVEYTEDEPK